MKKIIVISLWVLVLIISIISLVLLIIYNYQLWLDEYNAQIESIGYYKEDIQLLNQHIKYGLVASGITLSIFMILGSVIAIFIKWMND